MKFKSDIEVQAALKDSGGAVGTSGQVLSSTATGVSWINVSTGGVTTFSGGTTGLTPNTATSGAITLAGTLAVGNGGTGSTTAAGARTNLGATTVGSNIFTSTSPSAIRFLRANADNTVSWLDSATFRTAIGAGTGSGTVTSVAALTLGTTGTDLSSTVANGTTTPVITLNVPTASAANRGALSAADWTTFNSKQAALSGTGFVKISGTTISYDNSTYALDNAVVKLTGNQSITGQKTFNNSTTNASIFANNSSTGQAVYVDNTGGGVAMAVINSSTGRALNISNTTLATGLPLAIQKQGLDVFTVNDAGEATGTKFIKSGGTSSQFLMADGSVSTGSGGTVTSIATSGAILGGTITTTGTISHSTADGFLHVPATGTTNNGKVLTAGATAGTFSWQTPTSGGVTSVSGAGGYGGLTLTGTVTTTGSLTLGGTPTGTWPISVSGNAATVSTSLTTTNADHYLTFVDTNNGSAAAEALRTIGTIKVNPFTGNFSAPIFNGAGTGLTGTAASLSIGGNAATATLANEAGLVVATSGGAVRSWDIRTISPSSMGSYRMGFGFTSLANNNTSPYADYLHLRSYTDSSGGNDNLVMFNKSAIGMRIYQQTWGSTTAYASYKDIAFTDGSNSSGTWSISTSGNAGTATTLQTARTINGVSFNGSANITVADSTKLPLAGGTMTGTMTFAAGQTFPGTGSGTVTSVGGTGSYGGLTLSGTVTSTGNLTLGGTPTGTWPISVTGSSGSASTATNISNSGTVTLATATESNSITITQPSYTTDKPVKLLNFDWYGNTWSLGNIRTGATPSAGLGVFFTNTEKFRFQDGSFLIGGNTTLHAGNYNSYSPTLTGTGASGTWGISITGNANYASSAGSAVNAGNAGTVSTGLTTTNATYYIPFTSTVNYSPANSTLGTIATLSFNPNTSTLGIASNSLKAILGGTVSGSTGTILTVNPTFSAGSSTGTIFTAPAGASSTNSNGTNVRIEGVAYGTGIRFNMGASIYASGACTFVYGSTTVGTITTSTTNTTYNTSSDYRLKENVVSMAGSIDRVKLLKPCNFNFIIEPEKVVDGFLAHEVQGIIPDAVTGEKDAVDSEGDPIYQGIDHSKIVPLLTSALQEAISKIEELENRLSILEKK